VTAAGTSDGPATTPDRRELGIAAYAKIFGTSERELPAAFAARVGPVFAEEALHAAGGAAWAHPALTGRDRSIAIITALTALGVSGTACAVTWSWPGGTVRTRTRSPP